MGAHGAAGVHQSGDELGPKFFGDSGIRCPPTPSAHDDMAAVQRAFHRTLTGGRRWGQLTTASIIFLRAPGCSGLVGAVGRSSAIRVPISRRSVRDKASRTFGNHSSSSSFT